MTLNELRKKLNEYDRRYRDGEPAVSDLEYDRLLQKLRDMEAADGGPVPPDSPTRRLGSDLDNEFAAVAHRIPMLSIDNTYNIGELREFGKRVNKLLEAALSDKDVPTEEETTNGSDLVYRSGSSNRLSVPPTWVVELKVDGVAASLIYENGLLVQGLTRGNGLVGDDITDNVRTLRDIPLKLAASAPKMLEVRGEIYMRNSDLVVLNEHQQAAGLPTFANTRNVTAGSIKQKKSKICAERPLRFFAHSTGFLDGMRSTNHFDFLKELESYGIPATPHVRRFESFDAAVDYCESLYASDDNFLSGLDFEIDGLVLKLNDFVLREKLGATSKSPRWIIAYKVEKYEATTTLREIRVQVGKTGAVTPVGELEPVELAGTTVSRASLHNAEEIQRKDIRVGDVVVVEKAGKIIPHVVRAEKHLRKKELAPFRFPTECPVCGRPLTKDSGGVYIRCNNPSCPAQIKEKLRYFSGRNAMDIEGLGDKLIEQLVDGGLVENFGDLYRLDFASLEKLDRMGEKSAQKLLDAVQRSKSRDWSKLLNALSIRHVGNRTATVLAKHFENVRKLREATVEELSGVDEIGPIIAESVFSFFHSEEGKATVDDLVSLGLFGEGRSQATRPAKKTLFDGEEVETAALPLAGMTIVVTGSLEHFKRNEIEDVIGKHGGRVSSSVSSKTSFVLVGADPGSKLAKAEQLGVRIVREPEFREMLKR